MSKLDMNKKKKSLSYIKIKEGKKKIKYYLIYYLLVLFLSGIVLVGLLNTDNIRNLKLYYSDIHLVVQGSGLQKILSSDFKISPSEVLVNGIKDDSCIKTCSLQGNINNITLRFENQIESTEKMFYGLNNIIQIDLSEFDASNVKSFAYMFYQCSNLEIINFGNINTSSVEDMQYLFYRCSKLISLDLSNFDTSKVTNMLRLIYQCSNLEKINFGNINTSSVENMQSLIYHCTKLTSLDLSSFDTSNAKNMAFMFYYDSSLKYLDLSNFNTSKATTIELMFCGCRSLIYLNMYSFKFINSVNKNRVFNSMPPNAKYCVNDEATELFLFDNQRKSDCSDICFQKNVIFFPSYNNCSNPCSDVKNKYKYNNICYKECPVNTYILLSDLNKDDRKECYDKTPQGYYLDKADKMYKKCFNNCKYCYGEGNETINNCKECINNYTFFNGAKYINNCYLSCEYFYYFDESNEYHCVESCFGYYNKTIKDEKKCIDNCNKDDSYKYEYNNTCYQQCLNDTYLLEDNQNNQCYSEAPEGYYLDKENKIYKKCYESCSKCGIGGNETNNNCEKCNIGFSFYKNPLNTTNCYKTCTYY